MAARPRHAAQLICFIFFNYLFLAPCCPGTCGRCCSRCVPAPGTNYRARGSSGSHGVRVGQGGSAVGRGPAPAAVGIRSRLSCPRPPPRAGRRLRRRSPTSGRRWLAPSAAAGVAVDAGEPMVAPRGWQSRAPWLPLVPSRAGMGSGVLGLRWGSASARLGGAGGGMVHGERELVPPSFLPGPERSTEPGCPGCKPPPPPPPRAGSLRCWKLGRWRLRGAGTGVGQDGLQADLLPGPIVLRRLPFPTPAPAAGMSRQRLSCSCDISVSGPWSGPQTPPSRPRAGRDPHSRGIPGVQDPGPAPVCPPAPPPQ